MVHSHFRRQALPAAVVAAVVASILASGCQNPATTPGTAPAPAGSAASADDEILARVNGAALTRSDVEYWLSKNTQGRIQEGTPEEVRNALEALIGQELIRQESVRLGLHLDPTYQAKIRTKQAELDSLRRTEIRSLYLLRQVDQAAQVSEQDLRAYFDQHQEQLKTRFQVEQILRRTEDEIVAVRAQLAAGASFEQIASSSVVHDSSEARPSGPSEMRWEQMPEVWRQALDKLAIGAISDVVRGEGKRFWLLRLKARTPDPSVTFESIRLPLQVALQRDKVASARASIDGELRANARIEYVSR